MFECFDYCKFPELSAKYMKSIVRYAYLWGNAEKALQYLKDIQDAYFKVGIVDDHFLYMRGIPYWRICGIGQVL